MSDDLDFDVEATKFPERITDLVVLNDDSLIVVGTSRMWTLRPDGHGGFAIDPPLE